MDYFRKIYQAGLDLEVKNKNNRMIPEKEGVGRIITMIKQKTKQGKKVFFIGNGGSAAIASHMAIDFLKNAHIPAVAFNDPCALTCISNDLGYENVFNKPIEILARKGDILFAISSSGRSENILKAVKEAKRKGCFLITLSGFKSNNPLRRLGDINFYVPSQSYGIVETAHQAICHYIADELM